MRITTAASRRPHSWLCDYCSGVIENEGAGVLEWVSERNTQKRSQFKIIHHAGVGPRAKSSIPNACSFHRGSLDHGDLSLTTFTGADGLLKLLSWLDPNGPKGVLGITDVSEIVEVIRRLHVPRYELGRHCLNKLRTQGVELEYEINITEDYSMDAFDAIIKQWRGIQD